jgi:hypothetical protein
MALSQLPKTHEAKIPEVYLDVMGHLNVMWYTHLFDQAIYSMFDLLGLDRSQQSPAKPLDVPGEQFAARACVRRLDSGCVTHNG